MDDVPDQECDDFGKDHRAQVLINMTPDGLANCLENELKDVLDNLDFLTKKSENIKASIAKLRQP